MKNNLWEKFAREDAEYYILSVDNVDFKSSKGLDFFFESGRKMTEETMTNVQPFLTDKSRSLEIGCGIGRLSFPHSKIFKEASVVDISETMLEKLNKIAKEEKVTNITTYLSHEAWDQPGAYNYVYSYIVFQHIKDIEIIKNYIKRISNSLHKNNILQLHFDTRPENVFYTIRNILPDFLLPKLQRKGIRRIRRKSSELRSFFSENGLTIVREISPDSDEHTFILRKEAKI